MCRDPLNKSKIALLCVDSVENGMASGRFYHGDLDNERAFCGLHQFLLDMDRVMDGNCENVSSSGEGSSVIWRTGKVATFKLNVLFRQNGSWQGSVMWLETRHEERFRSALELLSIFHQALAPSQERRMRPSTLKFVSAK